MLLAKQIPYEVEHMEGKALPRYRDSFSIDVDVFCSLQQVVSDNILRKSWSLPACYLQSRCLPT